MSEIDESETTLGNNETTETPKQEDLTTRQASEQRLVTLANNVLSIIDDFRATSYLRLDEYVKPVLDLLFLAEANRRLHAPAQDGKWGIAIPSAAAFEKLLSVSEWNLGEVLNRTFHCILNDNPQLSNLQFTDFNSTKLREPSIRPLVQAFAVASAEADSSTFVKLFDVLLNRFAATSGQHSGEYSTPQDIRTLLIALLKLEAGMSLYDPCAGTAGFLKEAVDSVRCRTESDSIRLFGQEINAETLSIGQMYLALSGVADVDLRLGNSLTYPLHIDNGKVLQFDRVVSNPPFGTSLRGLNLEHCPLRRFRYGVPPNNYGDFAFIQHMLASLKPSGLMATIVSHGVLFRGGRERAIRKAILEDDLVEAVIGLPPALFYGTGISSAILVMNRKKSPERLGKVLFINADKNFHKVERRNALSQDDIDRITSTFDKFEGLERFATVVALDEIRANDYNLYIQKYADSSALSGLVTQYDSFEKVSLKELALEINSVKRGGQFQEKSNAVYIQVVGKRATDCLDDINRRHDKFYQVVLSDKAINTYVAQFFGTSIGQHALSIMAVGSVVQRLSKADLQECIIALPDLDMQQSITGTHNKLAALKEAINAFDRELTVNPMGLSVLQTQLDSMLNIIGKLSAADHIRSIIRDGESKTAEFKETFSLNIRHDSGQKDKTIEDMCLKTIVAFLNSEGGHLLVGVADNGKIARLDSEIAKFHRGSLDKFLLHFKNTIENRIGAEYYPFIDYGIVEADGNRLLFVKCKQSQKPCFLDGEVFYVRTNPATDKLVGTKQLEYIKHRFGI